MEWLFRMQRRGSLAPELLDANLALFAPCHAPADSLNAIIETETTITAIRLSATISRLQLGSSCPQFDRLLKNSRKNFDCCAQTGGTVRLELLQRV
jgi:hypothetical protein